MHCVKFCPLIVGVHRDRIRVIAPFVDLSIPR